MFRRVEHYHQWLHSSIHLATKFSQSTLIQSGYKGLQKELSLTACIQSLLSKNTIERVENVKSRVLQSPVSCTQASPKVEASNRSKQAQHLSTCRKVQNGNTRINQGFSDCRGMGVVNRPSRHLPSHPHPPQLKEVPKVLPQVAGVPVHFPPFWISHGPSGFYNDCKRGEADGPAKGNQTSPVPGRLADQGPVSRRSKSEDSDSGRSDSVFRVDNKSVDVRTKPNSGVFLPGLEYHLDSALVKPTQEPSHEALSVSPPGALEISSVVGHPPSLDRNHFITPRIVAKSCKRDKRLRPSSQRPQYPTLYRHLKRRLGHSPLQKVWSDREKRLHINVLELEF